MRFVDSVFPNHVCLPKKPLSILEQVSCTWSDHLLGFAFDLVFTTCNKASSSKYIYHTIEIIVVLFYFVLFTWMMLLSLVTKTNLSLISLLNLVIKFAIKDLDT